MSRNTVRAALTLLLAAPVMAVAQGAPAMPTAQAEVNPALVTVVSQFA